MMTGKIKIRLSKNIFNSLEYKTILDSKLSVFFEYTSDELNNLFDFSQYDSLFDHIHNLQYSGYIYSSFYTEKTPVANNEIIIPIIELDQLSDPYKCEHFVKRVYLLEEVRNSIDYIKNKYDLEVFHRRHKILLRLHNTINQKYLGRIICSTEYNNDFAKQKRVYYSVFLKSFNKIASIGNHYSILQRMLREINKLLNAHEREILQEHLKGFYRGDIPLSRPLNIIMNYAISYDIKIILEQSYLYLYPVSLKLKDNIRREI